MGRWRLCDRPMAGGGVVVPFPAACLPRRDYNGADMRPKTAPKDATSGFFVLGDWEVRPNNNELLSGGETRHLEPMVMDLLVFMAARAPEVVSKNAIIDSVWEGRFISEGTLTNTIAELRRVLGDDARRPRYIETIPKRGYRVVAEITGAESFEVVDPRVADWPEHRSEGLDPRRVLVLPFENRTGEPDRDVVGLMTMDWLSQGLACWAVGDVVPASTAREMVRPVESPLGTDPVLAAAEATGAGVIVWGSYYLDGGIILIQANVTDATEERLLWAMDPLAGRDGTVVEIIETLRQRVAGLLACHYASSTDEMGQVDLDVIGAPPSFEAYREFLAGREQVIGDMDAAIRRFRRAVELAPGFAPAWANLVICHFNTGDCEAAAAVVDEMNARCPLDKPAQEHMFAFFRARLDGRWSDALKAVQSLEAFAPHDGPTKMLVATTALRAGRPQVAVDACSAIRLRGRFVRHPVSIVRCRLIASAFHALGEHDRELDQVRAVAEVIGNPIAVLGLEVRALAAAGRFKEVESVLDRSLSIPAADSLTGGLMLEAALEIRAHGRRRESLKMAERAVAWVERRGRETVPVEVLRGALCAAEHWMEAADLYKTDAAEGDLGAMGALGWLSVRTADEARAGEIDARLQDIRRPYHYGEPRLQRAFIEAHRGNRDRAIELLYRAFGEGLPHDDRLHRDLGLEPLWDEPRFRELIGS
jgi:DNA-binding winged helix-turn-helix (wHTH) protein/tetratricopeptide (TPR) repeat protein/TolB-like protein